VVMMQQAAPVQQTAPVAAPVVPAVAEVPVETGQVIKSPMVGTFYRSSSPGAKAFAEVGDQVKEGQPICIIEAMKIMNEIETEVTGTVTKILVENGQPVEYGQPLFIVE
ncbi:MAG: acetyl-CoA carboxylase biotin carboxyl carrier protein, partial [Sulfuricaulis sp.]|nr:acetyl-CoA carboxylase biotin carboxyl carrier protein [Sulfuricaulis sp.]